MSDEDRSQARDSQALGVEARLKVINTLRVGHCGLIANEEGSAVLMEID